MNQSESKRNHYIQDLIDSAQTLINLAESDQRNFIKNNCHSDQFEDLRSQEESIWLDRLRSMERASEPTFSIGVMGSFNSGKSTLVNSLLGCSIAPTDDDENTCVLSSFQYGPEEKVLCLFKESNQSEQISIQEAHKILESHKSDTEWAKKIEKFAFETPKVKDRNIILWDTPGIASTTEENAQIVWNFMDHIDAVLWVFNAKFPGKATLLEFIDPLTQKDKYLIAIINKIDTITSDPERVISATRRIYGDRFEHILPFSAKKAIQNNDFEDGGLATLQRILEEHVYADKIRIKHLALSGELHALIEEYIGNLDRICWDIDEQLNIYQEIESNINNKIVKIEEKLIVEINHFMESDYLSPHLSELVSKLDELDATDASKSEYEKTVKTIISSDAEKEEIERLFHRIEEEEDYQWRSYFWSEKDRIEQALIVYEYKSQSKTSSRYRSDSDEVNENHNNVFSLGKRISSFMRLVKSAADYAFAGGIGGMVIGSIVAAASTAVTIASIPLVVLSGTALGGAWGIKYFFDSIDPRHVSTRIMNDVEQKVKQRRKDMLADVKEHIMKKIRTDSKKIKTEFLAEYCRRQFDCVTPKRWEAHKNSLSKIRDELNKVQIRTEDLRTGLGERSSREKTETSFETEVWYLNEPEVANQKLTKIIKQAKGYLKINDRHFGPDQLQYLQYASQDIPIYIMLFKFDEEWLEMKFNRELNKLRMSRQSPINVRLVSYLDRPNTPIHDRYIFSRDEAYNLSSSLNAIGRHDIRITRLKNPKSVEEMQFNVYWASKVIDIEFGKARLRHIDL